MKITCPTCRNVYDVPKHKIPAGKKVSAKCKQCGGRIVLEMKADETKQNTSKTQPAVKKEIMKSVERFSITACFSESLVLTRDNLIAFLGASILAWVCSILTLTLLFPALMTGLESMYLKAKAGERIKATDVFMHRRKWFSLYIDACMIAWHASWFAGLLILPMILVVFLLNNIGIASSQILIIAQIFGILIFLVVCYRESRHLHALNLSAEFGLRGNESRHLSKMAIKDRRRDAFFVVLLAITIIFYWSFDPVFTPISVLALLLVMGATSMAYLHDMGNNEKILELVENYRQEYRRELSKEPENPCPTCGNSNVYKTQTEFGQGDWCPDCKMSLREMRGLA